MLQIRSRVFETNSSSSDYYRGDDRDEYDGPSYSWCRQKVHIKLRWKDDTSDEKLDEFVNAISDGDIDDDIYNILDGIFDTNAEDPEVDETDYEDIVYTYRVYVDIIGWYGGYEGDRYCPPEAAEPEFDNSIEGAPGKNSELPNIKKVKDDLLKLFHEKGYTEIEEVTQVYGDELDLEELCNNISW